MFNFIGFVSVASFEHFYFRFQLYVFFLFNEFPVNKNRSINETTYVNEKHSDGAIVTYILLLTSPKKLSTQKTAIPYIHSSIE